MKLLLLYKTSPESPTYKTPSSFGVQGEVLARGLRELGVDQRLNQLDLVLATSNWVKEVLIRDGVTSPVGVVYEGVDTDVFKPISKSTPQVKEFRERFKLAESELLILTVGGDGMSKGFQEVVLALKQLEHKLLGWKYIVKVAASPTGKNQTKEDTSLVSKLGLDGRVIFFSEMLHKSGQSALFNAADIYAAPSHNEGFGRPLVEAQACGVPVLTVDGTSTREMVKHKISGFAAKVGEEIYKKKFRLGEREVELEKPKLVGVKADSADLAADLLVLADSNLRWKMGEAGRKFVLENFDYRKTAKDMVVAIKESFGVG